MASIYSRRLPSRCIRVLVIQPGAGSDPIAANLREASIDDPPSFHALSYVWGDPSQRGDIRCQGQQVSVTKSLFDALLHFRLPTEEVLIWADALCINQDDMEERAEQVQLMRDVYSRASLVVVWLGLDEDNETARAMPLMEAIYHACEDQALSRGVEILSMAHFTIATEKMEGFAGVSISDIASAAQRVGLPKPDSKSWNALKWLLSRPWFTRVWCVQEIVLARSSRVYVGSHSFEWDRLGVTAAWLSEQNLANDYDVPSELDGIAWENAYSMFDKSELSELSFLEILLSFRDFNATNPRDKVYGLLGLINEATLEGFASVDYKKTVAEVYIDVVKASVASSESLAPLCYGKHGVEYERTEFPSWVPRWDVSEDVGNILHSMSVTAWEEGNKHGLPGLVDFQPSSDGKVGLSGVRFDTIAWTTEVFDISHFKEDISPAEAKTHPFLEIWHRVSSTKSYPLFGSEDAPFGAVLEMGLTLTTNFTEGYEFVFDLEPDDRHRFYADYLTYIKKLFSVAGKTPDTYDPLEVALCEGDANHFRIAASRSCDQRRIFETASGFYGLAPACAKPGDVVVLLYGGPIPFVLRQTDDGWILLGDTFVGPLMPESDNESIRERFGKEELFILV
ncbi:Heterokaryon incompatibility protein 6, OR allele [Colletotrichum sp. SAR 10_77]|nr:Heterokaryon incompatibility protein 6, OR allele [Colletotrichum sp. SAR 10_77]